MRALKSLIYKGPSTLSTNRTHTIPTGRNTTKESATRANQVENLILEVGTMSARVF